MKRAKTSLREWSLSFDPRTDRAWSSFLGEGTVAKQESWSALYGTLVGEGAAACGDSRTRAIDGVLEQLRPQQKLDVRSVKRRSEHFLSFSRCFVHLLAGMPGTVGAA